MKIGMVTVDWSRVPGTEFPMQPGGAGFYRICLPYRHLKRHGVDVTLGDDLLQTYDGEFHLKVGDEIHDGFDLIVMQRWMSEMAAPCIEHARSTGQVIVQDIDDHFAGLDPQNIAWRTTHPRRDLTMNRNHYQKAIMASNAVTCSTQFLADYYGRGGKPIYLLENCIDLHDWKQRDVSGDVEVGWAGATGYRSGDLETLRGTLSRFLTAHSGVFHHTGHIDGWPEAADLLGLGPSIPRTYSPISGIEQYPDLFAAFTIGIVPLATKSFNEAKSHIKGLEYAASGIPFVASSTGEYLRFVNRLKAGATATRSRDWIRELEKLADAEYRVQQGQHARDGAEKWNMQHRWTAWKDTYETILKEAA